MGGEAAVGGGGGFEGFVGGVLAVVGATGEDRLAGAAVATHMDDGPAFHVVLEHVAYQRYAAVGQDDDAEGDVITRLPEEAAQLAAGDMHHGLFDDDVLAEGVEQQPVVQAQLRGGQRGEERRYAVDLAKPLFHNGQHAVAHRHAGQEEGRLVEGRALGEVHHGRPAHEGAETRVGRGHLGEERLTGIFQLRPQPATVRQLLSRLELLAGTPEGRRAVGTTHNHLSFTEIEGHSALFQPAMEDEAVRLYF